MFSLNSVKEYVLVDGTDMSPTFIRHKGCGRHYAVPVADEFSIEDVMNVIMHHDYKGCEHDDEFA